MALSRLSIERIFDFDVAEAWKCWHDPTYIRNWYGSDHDGVVGEVDIDFRVEGKYKISFTDSDLTQHTSHGKHLEIDPYNFLGLTIEWLNEPGQISYIGIRFTDLKSKTKIKFTLTGIPSLTVHDYEYGWNSSFDKMVKFQQKLRNNHP